MHVNVQGLSSVNRSSVELRRDRVTCRRKQRPWYQTNRAESLREVRARQRRVTKVGVGQRRAEKSAPVSVAPLKLALVRFCPVKLQPSGCCSKARCREDPWPVAGGAVELGDVREVSLKSAPPRQRP